MAQLSLSFDYHYGNEADQYTFYRLPKALFTDNRYKNVSDGAKILYGLMLDRMGLSIKNGWMDEIGRVYIYFTLEDVQELLNCQRDKGMKLLAELDTEKGVGLIERVKQGLGKPALIYVKKFMEGANLQTSEKTTSGSRKSRSLDYGKTDPNKNKINNTDLNDTDYQSIYPAYPPKDHDKNKTNRMDVIDGYRQIIHENIDYEILCERHDVKRMDEVVELILETISLKRPNIRIAGDDFPAAVVKSRLLKLDSSHIEYVFDCLDKNSTKIRNIKSYLLTALYNAPATMDSYYRAEVNHDLYGSNAS